MELITSSMWTRDGLYRAQAFSTQMEEWDIGFRIGIYG